MKAPTEQEIDQGIEAAASQIDAALAASTPQGNWSDAAISAFGKSVAKCYAILEPDDAMPKASVGRDRMLPRPLAERYLVLQAAAAAFGREIPDMLSLTSNMTLIAAANELDKLSGDPKFAEFIQSLRDKQISGAPPPAEASATLSPEDQVKTLFGGE